MQQVRPRVGRSAKSHSLNRGLGHEKWIGGGEDAALSRDSLGGGRAGHRLVGASADRRRGGRGGICTSDSAQGSARGIRRKEAEGDAPLIYVDICAKCSDDGQQGQREDRDRAGRDAGRLRPPWRRDPGRRLDTRGSGDHPFSWPARPQQHSLLPVLRPRQGGADPAAAANIGRTG